MQMGHLIKNLTHHQMIYVCPWKLKEPVKKDYTAQADIHPMKP
jgi:hypothetical protein